jgi:hypothetical protein
MKNKISQIIILIFLLSSSFVLAQSPCDHPVPDTCQGPPYMWCSVPPDHCPWDMNFNGVDIVYMVNYLKGFGHPPNSGMLDLNCDGRVNLIDVLYLVNYFKGRGPAPQCCVYICQEPQGPGSIGDFVWQDLDGDGIQDPGEPGLPNVQIRIYECNSDTLVDETQTDSLGQYRSRELGSSHLYRVFFDPPQGYTWSPSNQGDNDSLDSDADTLTGFTACVPAPTERPNNTVDCGMRVLLLPKSSIGDYVWFDVDSNGIQDSGEHGFGGVEVKLLNCNGDILDSMKTDSAGFFLFVNLNQGDYKLHFTSPFGYRFSPSDQGTNDSIDSDADTLTGLTPCVTLGLAEQADIWDAGLRTYYLPKSSIGDFVWDDVNRNGIQDRGEDGIGGVEVELLNCNGDILDSMKTDSTGFFLFVNLNQGDYKLHFTSPFGYQFSPPDQGSNDSLDSDVDPQTGLTPCVTLGLAEQADIWDAGMYSLQGENCTRVVSFWKNHAGLGHQPDLVTPLLPIWLGDPDSAKGIHVTSAQIAYDILKMHTYGDPSNGITKLYAQLLAAKLNIANGADGETISNVVDSVDTFLSTHDWHDWDGFGRDEKRMAQDWRITLQQYNGGEIGPGPCGDENINLR